MPDVCFAVYRAPAFNRPSAFRTNDAAAAAGDPAFTYDGGAGRHPSGTSQPGVVAMSSPPVGIITPLHEFLHAATSDVNGACWDLYADTVPVVREINRKRRASAAARLPVVFARYNGRDYESDLPARGYRGRGGIGYPAGWLSYGAALIDRSEPNVMDNYYLGPDLRLSRLDALTLRFVRDRIESKLAR